MLIIVAIAARQADIRSNRICYQERCYSATKLISNAISGGRAAATLRGYVGKVTAIYPHRYPQLYRTGVSS